MLARPFGAFRKAAKLWRTDRNPHPFPLFNPDENEIVFAFELGGVKYYTFADPFKAPFERGLKNIEIHEEFRMRITKESLLLSLEFMEQMLNQGNIVEIANAIRSLKERMEWIVEPETLFRLASTLYFAENENPTTYSEDFNYKKIKHWMRNKETLHDFFLQKPICVLSPLLMASPDDTKTYLVGAAKKNRDMLTTFLALTPETERSMPFKTKLKQKIQETDFILAKILQQLST